VNIQRSILASAWIRTLTGAALIIAGAASAQQAPLFPLSTYPTGDLPEDIAAGDVTGDGHPDLVTANRNAGTLSLLVGNGAGSFAPAVTLPAGAQPTGLALVDVSGDGIGDVVSGSAVTNALTLHIANGAGGFLAPQSLPVPLHPETVLAGDMDGDGKTDLVSVAFSGGSVAIEHGSGGGGFALSGTGSVGTNARDAVLADLDGDGDLDVITANPNAGSLSILSGNGAGGLTSLVSLPAVASMKSVAVGDLNADGRLDLASGTDGYDPIVDVWLGLGGGAFGAPVEQPLGGSAYTLAMVDFDADQKLDLVAADKSGVDLRWMSGDGAGGFAPVHVVPVGQQYFAAPWAMVVQDLDADADLDVALAINGSDRVMVLLADSPGIFPANTAVAPSNTTYPSLYVLGVGDVNGDGAADVITSPFALFEGDGAGGLLPSQPIASPLSPLGLRLTDMNGDGASDLVYLSTNFLNDFANVQLGNGAGNFASPVSTVVSGYTDFATGDVTGDGHADVVVLKGGYPQPNQIHVLIGDGAGGLGTPATVQFTNNETLSEVLLADVTGDGRQDALVLGGSLVYVLAGDGQGGFVPAGQFGVGSLLTGASSITVGDFDADGSIDLASAANTEVEVLINAGSGSFLPKSSLPAQMGTGSIAERDLDGDGLQDLLTAKVADGIVTVFGGEGAAAFAPGQNHTVVEGMSGSPAVADMDGDGAPDLILGHSQPPLVLIVRNLGEGSVWTDLGHALAGTLGAPTLAGAGELVAGTPGSIRLSNAAALAPAALFVSLQSQPQPFKGGLLVPLPPLLMLPLPTGPSGTLELNFTWPVGVPTGTAIYLQMAIHDAGAPADVALSNALKGMAG
jgi:hypothetical protein